MGAQTNLDPERVDTIFRDCLFQDGEDTSGYIKAEGITRNVDFHPERLENHRAEIEAMLGELPAQFQESGGGGWSFLGACNDRHGNQWTGFHHPMQQLFQLGIGINKVECQFPREMWGALPGGMPYYIIKS